MKQLRQRQAELDMLKLCAFVCVVCLHVAATVWGNTPTGSWQWQVSNFFRGTWGVPVFVMISGRFLLDPQREADSRKLLRYLLRVTVAFAFWSLFYEMYQVFVAYPSRGVTEVNWKWEAVESMTGEYHLWYLPMLAGLYLVTPFLRKITQDRPLMRWYLVLFAVFETVACYGVRLPKIGALIAPVFQNMHFQFAMGYTGYFVMGYYLFSAKWTKKAELWLYLAGILCLIATPLADIAYNLSADAERSTLFSENLTPNVMISAAAIYVFFCRRVSGWLRDSKVSKWASELESLGFGAYLLHMVFICLMTDCIGIEFLTDNPLFWIPVLTVGISAVSLAGAALLRKIPVIGKYIA